MIVPPERPALRHPGRLDGLDVSWCQQNIAYQRVADAGFRFVIVKVSEGLTGADPMRQKHLDGFRSVGLYGIVYGFMRPSKGLPREQVAKLWDSMGDTYTRIALDLETRDETTSTQQLVDFWEEAAEEVLKYGALKALGYSYPDYLDHLQPALGKSRLGKLLDLWLASYNGHLEPFAPLAAEYPRAPAPWSRATMWQYGGNGGYRVPGIPGACDRNLFMGDEEAFRTKMLGLPPTPTPEAA